MEGNLGQRGRVMYTPGGEDGTEKQEVREGFSEVV